MSSRLILPVAIAAGLAGGMLSRYIAPAPVLAQTQTAVPKELRAQSFVLVDANGTPYGLLGFNPQGKPIIKLLDATGKTLWSTESGVRLPSE